MCLPPQTPPCDPPPLLFWHVPGLGIRREVEFWSHVHTDAQLLLATAEEGSDAAGLANKLQHVAYTYWMSLHNVHTAGVVFQEVIQSFEKGHATEAQVFDAYKAHAQAM